MNGILQKAQEVKKALGGAAAVLVSLQAYGGWSTQASDVIKTALAVLATFGVVYVASNKPSA